MFMEVFFYLQMSFLSIIMLMMSYKYFLLVLIMVEMVVMSVAMVIFFKLIYMDLEVIFILYIVFGVCESVMGLAILIVVIRIFGDDYYNLFSLTKF